MWKQKRLRKLNLILDMMMEEDQQETLPEEWVKSIIFMDLALLQWVVDEEGKCLLWEGDS